MNAYVELKLLSDAYPGNFSGGLTMTGSESTKALNEIGENTYTNNHGHTVVLNENYREDIDVTEYSTTFINSSGEEATLELLSSVAISGIKCDKIHRLQSFWSVEGKLRTETRFDLHLEPSWSGTGVRVEKFGSIGSMPVQKYFPFVALEDSETGEFFAVQLWHGSSWQIELVCVGGPDLMLECGLADRDFGHWMKCVRPGESFTTPKVVTAKGRSLAEVCNKLVNAQTPNISPMDSDMGIMFNEFCTTWGNPTEENIKKCVDKLNGCGIKFFVIDAGWYGENGTWDAACGDWECCKTKLPNGMRSITDYIRSKGMIPGIWFELEVCQIKAKAFSNTDHMLKINGVPLQANASRFWDMTDEYVVKMLTEKVIDFLKENGFGYIKIDYNSKIGIGADGAESPGEKLRQCILASQDFFKKIKEEIPDIVIELCSSGGHRLVPSWLELCSQASFSDAHETNNIPIIASNLHRVMKPQQEQIWAVLRPEDSDERLIYTMANTFFGRLCLSGNIYDLSDKQWAIIKDGIKFYRMASDIIKNGETVYIKNDPGSYVTPSGEQLFVRKWNNKELVIAHRFENSRDIDLSFLNNKKIIAQYGKIDGDFTAKAWITEI